MLDFINQYKNEKTFNEYIIKDLRQEDTIYDYLGNVCKALETVKYVKYVGMEVIKDESKIKSKTNISIYDSRYEFVRMNFLVKIDEEEKEAHIDLFLPKSIDNNNGYMLDGNRYFGIYQLLDSSTYNTANAVTLKSILMGTTIKQVNKKIKDKEDKEYMGNEFILELFSHKINIMNYYLPKYGFQKTLKFFKFEKYFQIVEEFSDEENYLYFPIKSGNYVKTPKKSFSKTLIRNLFFTFYSVFNNKTDLTKLEDLEYWTVVLGRQYTKNTNGQLEKGESIMLSFNRILDQTTQNNLRISEIQKQNMFYLCRWLIFNFNELKKKDNLSLLNKRFRYAEFLIIPFVLKLSANTYRVLNSKNINMNKVMTLFKVPPMIIIKAMKPSKVKIELIRYDNVINDSSLFNHYLKYSTTGYQALTKSSLSSAYKDIHPSQMGRVALNQCSSNNPGTTGIFLPQMETIDKFYFSESEINY